MTGAVVLDGPLGDAPMQPTGERKGVHPSQPRKMVRRGHMRLARKELQSPVTVMIPHPTGVSPLTRSSQMPESPLTALRLWAGYQHCLCPKLCAPGLHSRASAMISIERVTVIEAKIDVCNQRTQGKMLGSRGLQWRNSGWIDIQVEKWTEEMSRSMKERMRECGRIRQNANVNR